jgi:uracil-DNA glycosylase
MILPKSWIPVVGAELEKRYFRDLRQFLTAERAAHQVFPAEQHVFAALDLTPFESVRVVILGQDPYHDDGQAHGLAFSVLPSVKLPGSLRNIFKELGGPLPRHGCLLPWAKQGVLLLNTVLTVRAHEPHSHRGKGWETFTDAVITQLSKRTDPMIFVLWGKPAQAKKSLIDLERHVVFESAHPSPLSAHSGFFGSKPFTRINEQLRKWARSEIDWTIPDSVGVP